MKHSFGGRRREPAGSATRRPSGRLDASFGRPIGRDGAPGQYEVYKKHVPHCEFIVYDGLPHNITDSVPERCASDLLRFLLAHRQAA